MTTHNNIDGKAKIATWLREGLDKEAINYAEAFGSWLARKHLTTTQIRNIYGEVKRIEMKDINATDTEIILLKPKLAYAKARGSGKDSKEALGALADVLSAGIDAIFLEPKEKKFDRFKQFSSFFEAVIAYHRARGGK